MKRLILSVFILFPASVFAQIWQETFNGISVGTTQDNGSTAWTTVQPIGSGAIFSKQSYPGYEIIAVNNTLDEGVWISEEIDISSAEEVAIEITWGSYWASSTDYLRAYYKVDDGVETLFGEETGKPNLRVASAASAIVSGDKVQIIIRGKENTASTYGGFPRMMGIDDVTVSELTYLYSRQSGNWNNTNTWSTTGYSGASCSCTPDDNSHVFVGNSRIVNLNMSTESAGVTIEGSGRINYTANAQLDVVRGGVLEIASSSTLDRNGNAASLSFTTYNYNVEIDGDLSIDNLIIDAANATFSGTGNMNIAGDLSINNVISKSILTDLSGILTVGDDINFNSSSNNFTFSNTGNLSVNDRIYLNTSNVTITNSGTFTIGNGGIVVNDNADDGNVFSNSGDLSTGTINLNNADFTLNNYGSITQTGDFTNILSGSSFYNFSGATWEFSGSGTNSRLFLSAANNSFSYSRSGNQTVFVPADGAYDHLTVSGSGVKIAQGNFTINNDLTIAGTASLDMSSINYDLQIAGDWIVTSTGSDPFVQRNSEVTFNSNSNQVISSVSNEETFHQLIINKSGGNVILDSSPATNLTVSSLVLTNGSLHLNGNALNVSGSSPTSVSRSNGSIISETNAAPYSKVNWSVGTQTSEYVFPFANAAGNYIPFIFDITTAGLGAGTLSVATYATSADNTPYPDGVMDLNGSDGFDNSANVVNRFWQIDLNGFTNNPISTVTFTASPDEVGSNSSLRAQRWNAVNSGWDDPLEGQTNPDLYSVTIPNVSQFSPWTLSDGSSPLPVRLLDFRAIPEKNSLLLEWTTNQEINNDYYTVEKTRNFKTFYEVGIVKGQGSTNEKTIYQLVDNHPFVGISYYRLKQTDFDGQAEIFKPISFNWQGEVSQMKLYPNPFNGRTLTIELAKEILHLPIEIYNSSGQIVYFSKINDEVGQSGKVNLSFSNPLLPGIYLMKIGDINKKLIVK